MSDHFLFICVPFWGHVFPSLAVAEELIDRGHRVTFLTGTTMTEAVHSVGADVLLYESLFENADMYELANEVDRNAIMMTLYDEGLGMLRAAEKHFDQDVPDLVAYDIATSLCVGRLLSTAWNRPTLTLNPIFASNDHFSVMQAALASDTQETTAPPLEFGKQLEVFGLGELVPKIAHLLASRGIRMSVEDFCSGVEDFNLVYLPRAFQYAGETFDERFAFVGPCLGKRSLLGEWSPPDDGNPVVLVSLGTVFNRQPSFFRTCIQAFSGVPVHVVMTVGQGGVDPAELAPLPPNIEVHRWAPHHTVLQHAKALVTHGGTGSVMEALHAGCSVLVMPLTRDAQPTGRRIAELGLGRCVQPQDIAAETLRRNVLELIADDATTERVREMQQATRDAGGTVRAANEVEEYLQRTRH